MTTVPAPVYPMRYGGGLFLCFVGATIALGALLGGNAMAPLLLGGLIAGTISIFVVRPMVARRYGRPTQKQIQLMIVAIALELAGFVALSWLTSNGALPHDPQFIWTSVLVIVAAHFVLMTWSFSAWILYLALAILAWVACATALNLGLSAVLVGDGLLKLGFGATMAAPLYLRSNPTHDIH
jgi:hypothetical protein